MAKIVVALGGNAILRPTSRGTAEDQMASVYDACGHIVGLLEGGHSVIVTHGNGPQVGNLLIQQEEGIREGIPALPLDSCVAMTQGQIGYMLQRAMMNHIRARGLPNRVATVITQVRVDEHDSAFNHPTKPVGPFYTTERARHLINERGYDMAEVEAGVWRRVVPSPEPLQIMESPSIVSLFSEGALVITTGGGGIPVAIRDGSLIGVDAVVDKDLASERLAADVGADVLMLLTDVDRVMLDYGRSSARALDRMSVAEAREYLQQGQFPPGSMGPKVAALIRFIEAGGKHAVIASLRQAIQALDGTAGTTITP